MRRPRSPCGALTVQVVDDLTDIDVEVWQCIQEAWIVGAPRDIGQLTDSHGTHRRAVAGGQLFQSMDDVIGHVPQI